uniref:CD44 antigen n=1 Tax=Leptobrachium leishanense TaxID=445787 RepID=A0A8C5MWD9_9ANUR
MLKNLWIYSLGLFALIVFCQGETVISCRFKGVYHLEKDNRYQILREEAENVCHSFNSTLATIQELRMAYEVGFETCRYGFIQEGIVIPRITSNPICAAGFIGIYNLTSNITQPFDVYCFNASETRDKDCDPVILPNAIVPSYDPSIQEMNPQDTHADTVTPTDPGKATYVPLQPTDDEYSQWTADPQDPSTDQHDEHVTSGDHESQTTNQGMGDLDDSMSPSDDLLPLGTTKLPYVGGSHGYGDHPRSTYDNYEDTTDTYVNRNSNYDVDEGSRNPGVQIPKATDSTIERDYDDYTGEYDGVSIRDGHRKDGRRANTSYIASPDASPVTNQPKQKRESRVPDWLIVVVALVSLGLILSVCIALNTRRICGQKKKLVINGKKANLEDGAIIEQNGDTAKSQEMVQLVSHDPPEQSIRMSQEDLRNIKGVDMKIGI